jgi:hypothetical protein
MYTIRQIFKEEAEERGTTSHIVILYVMYINIVKPGLAVNK